MKKYNFIAVDQEGHRQRGKVSAVDEGQAAELIKERGLIPIEIGEIKELDLNNLIPGMNQVSEIDRIIFTRQLAVMMEAGMPIVKALQALEDQVRDPQLSEVIGDISVRIDGGASLHEAMFQHPKVFNDLYLSLIRAGEKSGNLVEVLKRLAETTQRSHDFKAETKGAMIYPLIIIVVMLGVVFLMFVFVIPQLKSLFEQSGAQLPITTRMLLVISEFMTQYWWAAILIVIGSVVGLKRFAGTEKGKRLFSRLQLKMPIFGGLTRQMEFTTFCRTFAMLLSSGLPILECLEISTATLSNWVFKKGVKDAAEGVERGKNLGEELSYNDPIHWRSTSTERI